MVLKISEPQNSKMEALPWDTVEISIPARFERCVEEFPHLSAVVDRSKIWTYDELNRTANRIALYGAKILSIARNRSGASLPC